MELIKQIPSRKRKLSPEHIEKARATLKRIIRKPRGGGYCAIHKWLYKHYGKANKCENPLCKKLSFQFQWAKKKGCDYEHKRENFIMLCQTCHRNYDHTPEWARNSANAQRGKKLTEVHKQAIKKACRGINIGNRNACKKRKESYEIEII